MSERAAFLRHICENPADDTPRLVFADWLDENARKVCWRCEGTGKVSVEFSRIEPTHTDIECGSCGGSGAGEQSDGCRERAAFIRYQIAEGFTLTATGGPCAWTIDGTTIGLHAPLWTATNAFLKLPLPKPFTISRGFVSAITLSQDNFLARAADIFAAHPVAAVTLSDRRPSDRDSRGYVFNKGRQGCNAPSFISTKICRHWPLKWRGDLGGQWSSFATESEALSILSAACVAFGRKFHKLPAL